MMRALLVMLLVGCSKPSHDAEVARARAAMEELQKSLGARLQAAMSEGGPAKAVEVCAEIAPTLAREVGQKHQLELGRTSHKLRNPANAPRPWVEPYLAAHGGKPAASAPEEVKELGEKIGVIRPIPTGELCLVCHGQTLAPETEAALEKSYPDDRARGFLAGQVRGVFWAEVPLR